MSNNSWVALGVKIDSLHQTMRSYIAKTEEIEKDLVEIKVGQANKKDLRKTTRDIKEDLGKSNKEIKQDLEKLSRDIKEDIKSMNQLMITFNHDVATKFNDPKEGVYFRLQNLDSWKSTVTKVLWILVTVSLGLVGAVVKKMFLT